MEFMVAPPVDFAASYDGFLGRGNSRPRLEEPDAALTGSADLKDDSPAHRRKTLRELLFRCA
jgi:hypothetical protein